MPYTPPSARSPVASRSESPTLARSQPHNNPQQQYSVSASSPASRPVLTRSASSTSYLRKHRRSPSISKSTSFTTDLSTPDDTPSNNTSPEDGSDEVASKGGHQQLCGRGPSNAVAAAISPPDSGQNSSDDEIKIKRGRVRDLANLAELQAAIRIIEQHRMSSPDRTTEETKKARSTLGLDVPRLDTSAKEHRPKAAFSSRPPLSDGARKISHSRSSTDASAFLDFPRNNKLNSPGHSTSESEEDEDDLRVKPAMVRKKSGELVRPALRASSASRRPSSMPGTPTYGKAVHFDARLEHVRHFLQVDRPVAVSAGTSPVDSLDDESEFPFSSDEDRSRSPPFEWEIRLTNFPCETLEKKTMPIKVERVYLSCDKKTLVGAVAVRNIAFHKFVVARFTLDYWKTTSEVVADFNNDVRRKQTDDGYDPFIFSIKLEDQANLENKTLFFCVRYNVNGQEHWDNNDSINYQVDFCKKAKPMNGQKGNHTRSFSALSRSNSSSPAASGRPNSMPVSADDFNTCFGSNSEFFSFPQPPAEVVGDSPIRFRNSKPAGDIVAEAPGLRTNAANQAFGNRYDFGASLSATINSTSNNAADRSGNQPRGDFNAASSKPLLFKPIDEDVSAAERREGKAGNPSGVLEHEKATKGSGTRPSTKPVALIAEKPALQSSSYHELLDKYCFFGSAKGAQAAPQLSKPSEYGLDGSSDNTMESAQGKVKLDVARSLSPPRKQSSPVEGKKPTPQSPTPAKSRSTSPGVGSRLGSRSPSPVTFGYPYNQSMQNSFFPGSNTPTAIRG